MDKGVQRWAVNVSLWTPSPHQFRSCISLLPPCERSSVVRFVNFEDQKRALLSRLLQRKLVQFVLGLNYDCIVVEQTPEGKPYLVCPVSISLSTTRIFHSGLFLSVN
jgi:4'-phosphopantetheinyl transferase